MTTKLSRVVNIAVLIVGSVGTLVMAHMLARQVIKGGSWLDLVESLLAMIANLVLSVGAFHGLRKNVHVPERYTAGALARVICYLAIQVLLG